MKSFRIGEAPMTVCMVIEFSNLFQSYWPNTWYQTLQGVLRLPARRETGGLRRGGGL